MLHEAKASTFRNADPAFRHSDSPEDYLFNIVTEVLEAQALNDVYGEDHHSATEHLNYIDFSSISSGVDLLRKYKYLTKDVIAKTLLMIAKNVHTGEFEGFDDPDKVRKASNIILKKAGEFAPAPEEMKTISKGTQDPHERTKDLQRQVDEKKSKLDKAHKAHQKAIDELGAHQDLHGLKTKRK